MNPGLRFSIYTFGCKLNFSESSFIARQLSDAGYAQVDLNNNPDVLVINTCSVTENADKKCKNLVRKSKLENPNLFTVIIGCYAQLKPDSIAKMDGVNLVLGASEKFNLVKHLTEVAFEDEVGVLGGAIKDVKEFVPSYSIGDRTRTFLKVQDGCDYFCSFCTIPLARGLSRSPEISLLVDQAKEIAQSGVKEIVLTGVNIGDFGAGREDKFIDLIRELDQIEGIQRFRISSIEPNLLTDEVIQFVSTSKRFVPHFHIPLQSGSDFILKEMRRKYDTSLYRNRIESIRSLMPDACIGVDVITGFPGETEDRFHETIDFIMSLDVNYLHVFTYSERSNTKAKRMEGSVPVEIRRNRSRKLQEISRKMKREFYNRFIGQEMEVLFENTSDGLTEGFTKNYIRVESSSSLSLQNSIKNVCLESLNSDDVFIGTIIEEPVPELSR